MILIFDNFLRFFSANHDEDGAIEKQSKKKEEIETSTDALQKRTEELLAEMIRRNECPVKKQGLEPND